LNTDILDTVITLVTWSRIVPRLVFIYMYLLQNLRNVVVQIRNVENTKVIIRTHQSKKDRQ